jgi:hypothetical protein
MSVIQRENVVKVNTECHDKYRRDGEQNPE